MLNYYFKAEISMTNAINRTGIYRFWFYKLTLFYILAVLVNTISKNELIIQIIHHD